ncbi:hypothetical protein A3K29_05545 [Candidatus Collierbacteria bacterium RIFOXYB2_FULL_46_14]|uniref:Uncharacterized protein n=1 Tax=Candidatus Collierbacteria bacterium GW2011_GWA2_46_26 TaxID=1618381 RepID=A0A0G1PKV2_9BACT|nr:MAG: hypothetical protein UX47_C0004G0006 [Candidatus Collierbacteria bacterium GW2011_GWA2_46_26]OGD73554.1 MAG: hypothetical protein A3K29_05545 [Candidatus Collierbacteria bacterium RIFOXYB2_FULL_46_14]OGD76596.1 MAG: hypothetical protein A3K43_05545 [Candidatus Collierbacteria bacterium RIFOXYA2_FULL_46_20]OGD77932.1 MAG: hypothetical protein A3K39_05545 [Candidatus Collierbacteria bacterium RIFOXYC2_FULL_43_15]OGD81223.1 MAG: hypothetical protein A2320_06045 [Pseudomonadales bacterium G
MRKITFWLTAFMILMASCTPSPAVKLALTSVIATPTSEPTTIPTLAAIKLQTVTSYVCLHTGTSFSTGEPADFRCNLDTQEFTFTFAFGETVTAGLFGSPEPVVAGQPVSITTYANIGDLDGTCVLTDSQTGAPLQATLTLREDLVVRSDCVVGDHRLTMAYNVRVIPPACVPAVIWESQTPENFSLVPGGTYIVEVAFPNVTGDDAWWAHETSWVEIATTGPLTFLGAVGKAYEFKGSCTDWDRMEWATHNLVTPPGMLENFLHAGVVK